MNWLPPQLEKVWEKVKIGIILKTRIFRLQISFRLRQLFAGTVRKWKSIFRHRNLLLKKNNVSDGAIGVSVNWAL